MAEALCGPSNALHTFKQHTSVDRSLQQDRLALRQSPSQGFRSNQGPSNGYLDAEFEQFQSNLPLLAQPDPFFAHQTSFAGPSLQAPQVLPSWASDFQQLNLNEARASPVPFSQFKQAAPLHRSTQGGWHSEFLRHNDRSQTASPALSQNGATRAWQPSSITQPYSTFGGMQNFVSPIAQQKQPERFVEDEFDEAAFEAAFDSVKRDSMEEQTSSKGKGHEVVEEPKFNMDFACTDPGDVMGEYDFDSAQEHLGLQDNLHDQSQMTGSVPVHNHDLPMSDLFMQQEQPLLGADAILVEHTEEQEQARPDVEADELARTAGQLLDNLRHEHSEKFANSSFLSLMRQLRDKEVRVEGEKIVDVGWTSPQYGYYDIM